jgi:hypothetical protein
VNAAPFYAAADLLLKDARHGLDGKKRMSNAEIDESLDNALAMIELAREAEQEDRNAYMVARAKMIQEEELPQLETARRLLAYARDCGVRGGGIDGHAASKLLALLETAPPLDKKRGIRGALPCFEWLAANRRDISELLNQVSKSTIQ